MDAVDSRQLWVFCIFCMILIWMNWLNDAITYSRYMTGDRQLLKEKKAYIQSVFFIIFSARFFIVRYYVLHDMLRTYKNDRLLRNYITPLSFTTRIIWSYFCLFFVRHIRDICQTVNTLNGIIKLLFSQLIWPHHYISVSHQMLLRNSSHME